LLYKWKGTDDHLKPVLFNAHLDVVPVAEDTRSDWSVDPFKGEIKGGFIWGRGTLDMKNQLIAILDSVEDLLKEGYSPKRTIYLAFGHDEEISGLEGSKLIVEDLKNRGVQFAAVLDEGGLLTKGIIGGINEPVGALGMTEKGYVTFVLTAQGEPGHSSIPPRQTAIGIISRAVALMDDNPMPPRLDFVIPMLGSLGHLLPFGQQLVIANAWFFKPLLIKRFASTPQMNAMIRTTHAATIIEGGIKDNILPASASAKVNCRILPGDTVQDVIDHFTKVIGDPRIKITIDEHSGGWEPSGISSITDPAYLTLELVIRQIFENVDVAPFPVLAATDSRYYQPICRNIYKFSPILIGPDDRSGIHGINEKISVAGMGKMVVFFKRLMRVWGEAEF
jgi:carboxypeptidase PM20D1